MGNSTKGDLYTYIHASAKFWIIAFNEAVEIINEYGVMGQGFADDCGPMIGGDNTHEMYKSMQRILNRLYHWGKGKI